ncbi:hypothetical protein [Streptomyces sp. NPDC007940]|uniref:hypothetical protein n=1 Tax=Streptomyces sp. NPDC007940 TaxID=3364796 RepID=UPI0036E93EAD
MSDFQYWCTRSRVRRFVRETFEDVEEYGINLGPTQDQVAAEFFDGDLHQALAALRDLERLGDARRVVSFGEYRWIPAEVPRPAKSSTRTRKVKAHTELTRRILKYVTDEFNEGKAGNRDYLPSTHDVAKACVRGGGDADSCRRALKHLHRLMASGEIIQVKDEDVSAWSWHCAFWALPDSGIEASEAKPEIVPVNRFGFTDEEWAAMKPWQRNAIRSIEMAEMAPSSW